MPGGFKDHDPHTGKAVPPSRGAGSPAGRQVQAVGATKGPKKGNKKGNQGCQILKSGTEGPNKAKGSSTEETTLQKETFAEKR